MKDVIIVGGGLAGLICAIELGKAGLSVLLVEKKVYPFHRVCGEYISNEVLPYLTSLGINLGELGISCINKLVLTSPSGKMLENNLGLGGFGISRYRLDEYLCNKAKAYGVDFILGKSVEHIEYLNDHFSIILSDASEFTAKVAIGSFGKRSKLDKKLNRLFMTKRSPYIGVKYHIKGNIPTNVIALHNFKDGYCGISKIEDDLYNLCYLSHRNNLRDYKNIRDMEEAVLFRNPHLKEVFLQSTFVFDKPETINEITFEQKTQVENHILLVGDAAGMITPLCGNGMAMAIHAAKIASACVIDFVRVHQNRSRMESSYQAMWSKQFKRRLWAGRNIQNLFGKEYLTEAMISLFKTSKSLTRFVISQTHGQAF